MQIQSGSEAEFKQLVKTAGLRMNKTKQLVFNLLLKSDKPLSMQEIVAKIPDIHFVSVYRTVDALRKAGVVVQVPQGFKNLFELSDVFSPHHHHIACEQCGKLTDIDDQEIEILIEKVSRASGYSSTKHHLELYGRCASCQLTN